MHRRPATLTTAALLVALTVPAAPMASSQPGPHVEILINGRPVPQHAARGATYVEAVKGEYAIRLTNPYPLRVAVALSVDGLNTIDARATTAVDARKWVLGPYETVTISGWQTSRSEARRFEFTTEERSYAASRGRTQQLGVIEAVFFRERLPGPRYTMRSMQEAPMPSSPVPAEGERRNQAEQSKAQAPTAAGSVSMRDEYAATGMGRRTDHAVQQVWLDLEDAPASSVRLRYEFRAQLVRLGVLPANHQTTDVLSRRERARGFEPGFCPPR